MSCGCIDEDLREQKRVDELITRQLKEEWNKRKWERIIVLLGNSSSGKTTLMKQLRSVFGKGFSEDIRKKYIGVIHYNVLVAVKALLLAMAKLSIKYENPVNERAWKHFANTDLNKMEFNRNDYSLILQLWKDTGVHSRRRELQLPNSADYFLDDLDRILSNNYIPTIEDILRVYEPTSGVEEHSLMIGTIAYRVVDVGRRCLDMQRKWIHFFDGCAVSAVLFTVDISEYDQMLVPSNADKSVVNCLENSKALFQKFSRYQYENFRNSVFILLFNKEDVFDDKIHHSHLTDHFPAYTGPKQNPERAKNFICDMFIDSIPDKNNHITIHFINATDSNSAREVCKAVKHGVKNVYEFNSLLIY